MVNDLEGQKFKTENALSTIDLIPDFIPVTGDLEDIIIAGLGLATIIFDVDMPEGECLVKPTLFN